MPRQQYTSEERWLFKRLPNEVLNGQLKPITHQTIGQRFLCDIDEVTKVTGDLTIGNRQTLITEKVKSMEQLDFADGDLIAPTSTLTDNNASSISNLKSNLYTKRGARSRRNTIKVHMFNAD